MPETDAGIPADDIASVLEQAPGKAASAETIHGHLEMQGIEATVDEVRQACDELVDDGMLGKDDAESDRYRLVDRGAR